MKPWNKRNRTVGSLKCGRRYFFSTKGNDSSISRRMDMKEKQRQAKEYEAYVKQFTPKPKLFINGLKAFVVGGLICCGAFWVQNLLMDRFSLPEKDAKTWVTVCLICGAQLITGFGWFDSLAKFCGAGCIVPITGFANAMVSPAIEYKAEGPVLGVGAKLFSVAGPVLVCGITASVIVGVIHWGRLNWF